MKWIIGIIVALAALLFGVGWVVDRRDAGGDDQVLAAVFYIGGCILIAVDLALLAGWGIVRLMTS